jgi:hypothetical protein
MVQGVNTASVVAFAERSELLRVESLLAPRALFRGQLARGEFEDALDFAPPLD